VAAALKQKYRSLKEQGFQPDDIFGELIFFVMGDATEDDLGLYKAAEVIVSYFFHTCDVFEGVPQSA